MKNRLRRIANPEEYRNYLTSDAEVFFFDSSDSSPISEISSSIPHRIFTGIQGSYDTSGAQGTVYVGRNDTNDTVVLNIDAYRFSIPHKGVSTIRGIDKNTEYHHTDEIPGSWNPPSALVNRIRTLRRYPENL